MIAGPENRGDGEMRLPRPAPTARAATAEEAPLAPLVVLVEAEAECRKLLCEYLLFRGAVPMPAPSGAHAEVLCQALWPDLVLIDLPLPGVDAITLIRGIRARRPAVPITAWAPSDRADDARYRTEGVNEVVAKPIDLRHIDRMLCHLGPSPRSATSGG
jgi:DNA-binding response OmpR family regulator